MNRRMQILSAAILSTTVAMPFSVNASDKETSEWKLELDKNGISVYTRKIPDSDYLQIKAETTISAPAKQIHDIVSDANQLPNWLFELADAKVVKQITETQRQTYMISDLPWPLADRHYVVENQYGLVENGNYYHYTFDKIDAPVEGEGMESVNGFVNIIPNETGGSHIVYQLHVEPGGVVPSWLANLFLIEGPYETLLSLNNLVTKPHI